jgi:hypothetical protein
VHRFLPRRLMAALVLSGLGILLAQVPGTPPKSPNPPLFKRDGDRDTDPNGRQVEGTVKDQQDNPIEGAVVKVKNTKSLALRSFITKNNGKYRFSSLRKDVEYELMAEHQGKSSDKKSLSVFDDRKLVIINLKIEDKK